MLFSKEVLEKKSQFAALTKADSPILNTILEEKFGPGYKISPLKQEWYPGGGASIFLIEKAGKNFSAYSPDLPGCVSTGKTREEAEHNMLEAMQLHIDGTIADGEKIPKSNSSAITMLLEIPDKKQATARAPRLLKSARTLGRNA